jgi:hypothetical protein
VINAGESLPHLACFTPGMLALGHLYGVDTSPPGSDEDDLLLAVRMSRSCYDMYHNSPSGLAPDTVGYFQRQVQVFYPSPPPAAPPPPPLADVAAQIGGWAGAGARISCGQSLWRPARAGELGGGCGRRRHTRRSTRRPLACRAGPCKPAGRGQRGWPAPRQL